MEIYITRHGETPWNTKRKLQGNADIELNEKGRDLAIKTGEALLDVEFDCIYSSPLKRALETAELIRGGRDIPIIPNENLREINFGCMEGQCFNDLVKDETLAFKYFFDAPEKYIPPEGGETFSHVIERASRFMQDTVEPLAGQYKRIMIVAHGALNKGLMSYIKKHGLEQYWSGGLQSNCGVIIVEYSNNCYTIKEENKTFY